MTSQKHRLALMALYASALVAAAMLSRSPLQAQDAPIATAYPVFMPIVVNQPPPPEDFGSDPVEGAGDGAGGLADDLIFADDFEAGNLALWHRVQDDGGDLSVNSTARISGGAGLSLVIDDGDPLVAMDIRPTAERRLRARLLIDPNGIRMADGDSLVIFAGYSRGDARLVQMELIFSGGSYALRAGMINDANKIQYTAAAPISDSPHAIEIDWQRATKQGSNNGSLRMWIDGNTAGTLDGVDNNWRSLERVRVGVVAPPRGGTRGAFFLDGYESRRTSYIGLPGETQPGPMPTPQPGGTATPPPSNTPPPVGENPAVVFVQRQIPSDGSIYWDVVKDMPGVGAHSRFRVAAPGKLLVREPNGNIRTLIDGASPTAASLSLIDVNAPDVSYDGTTIVFAGLPNGSYGRGPVNNPDAWRLYSIRADGSGLRQITRSDRNISLSQFGAAGGNLDGYDDTDPAWLPDGRIVFSSTRWPSYGHYSGVRATNLFVVNADGANLHRITAERNGADRPMVDPITGKIVYARWWRNHRFALDSFETVTDPAGGFVRKDGLTTERNNQVGGNDFSFRNSWHAATINPDGTGLAQWGGTHHRSEAGHMYGGAFLSNGDLIANFFPMSNMTEAAGFGGLNLFRRGPGFPTHVIGVTSMTLDYVNPSNPTSFGIFKGNYAGEPAALPDGRLIISWARDVNQDYGLYTVNANGSGLTPVYDNAGTTELRAKPIVQRALPPILPDSVNTTASALPPTQAGPYTPDGTFTFKELNVYANGPVDSIIADAPPVGSAAKIRFFTDFQRTSPGSFPNLDWPILLAEMTIAPDGSVTNNAAPANLPLFEQLRSPNGTVPVERGLEGAAAHVAGMNFGKPGEVQRCVGCHSGHTMIAVPTNDADALFSNVAPSAAVAVSSSRDASQNRGLVDRKVMTGEIWRYWNSANGQTQGQWVQLTFPVPVTVRTVRLYNPRSGDEANSSLQVQGTNVRLYSDAGATQQVAAQSSGALAVTGTNVAFSDVKARVVRVEITGMSGTFYGSQLAGLAEVEVIARAEAQ